MRRCCQPGTMAGLAVRLLLAGEHMGGVSCQAGRADSQAGTVAGMLADLCLITWLVRAARVLALGDMEGRSAFIVLVIRPKKLSKNCMMYLDPLFEAET